MPIFMVKSAAVAGGAANVATPNAAASVRPRMSRSKVMVSSPSCLF
jgi:hypothetical protein